MHEQESTIIIEAGMVGYSFVVLQEISPSLRMSYSVERQYLYLDEEENETWGLDRQKFDSWDELFDIKGNHIFTLQPIRICNNHRDFLQRELVRRYQNQTKEGIHPHWRAFLGECDESFLPSIEQ